MELRSLTPIKQAVALAVAGDSNKALTEIAEIPLATAATKRYRADLYCTRTGILCGSFNTISVAGHMPLLGQWKDTQVLHPLFSLGSVALLKFARNSYLRYCAFTPEETADSSTAAAQEQLLCIAALAMIHNLTEVRQDVPYIPAWQDVATHWTSLMQLGYWKAYLDSQRFRFPSLRISKLENKIELGAFLRVCWQCRKAYETAVDLSIEEEKTRRIAEAASKSIFDEIAGKRPKSVKLLWRWFEQVLPTRYKKDLAGWMHDLFFATERDILEFTVKDIELFEEIFLGEVELGSSLSHAFLEVLRSKHSLLTNHFNTYEILIPDTIAEGVAAGTIDAGTEPVLSDYASRTLWFIAHAKWKLAQSDTSKHQAAARERQRTATVRPTFVPRLVIGAAADEIPELEADDSYDGLVRDTSDSGFGALT